MQKPTFVLQIHFDVVLNRLKTNMVYDTIEYIATPRDFEACESYYYRSGIYRYTGSKKWTRDARTAIKCIAVASRWLYGMRTKNVNSIKKLDSLNINCAADASKHFFDCATWSNYLSIDNIDLALATRDFHAIAKLWRDHGMLANMFFTVLRQCHGHEFTLSQHSDMIKLFKSDKEKSDEIIDIILMLQSLKMSLKTAKKLFKSHQKSKQIVHIVDDTIIRYKAKITRKSLHDFLVSVDQKLASVRLQNLQSIQIPQVLKSPDSFLYIATIKDLVKISKKNGWCTTNNYYTRAAIDKKLEFFYAEKEKVLAGYDPKTCTLKEQKAAYNATTNLAPKFLYRIDSAKENNNKNE